VPLTSNATLVHGRVARRPLAGQLLVLGSGNVAVVMVAVVEKARIESDELCGARRVHHSSGGAVARHRVPAPWPPK
jgi:hypothetical protein